MSPGRARVAGVGGGDGVNTIPLYFYFAHDYSHVNEECIPILLFLDALVYINL